MHRRSLLATLVAAPASGCLGSMVSESPGSTPGPSAGYRIADLSVSTTYDGPSHRYALVATTFASRDSVEGDDVVMDVADVGGPPVRQVLRTAASEGEWHTDALPGHLASLVSRVDFFTGLDGRADYVGFELYEHDPDSPPALAFSTRVLDGTVNADSPGALEFALTNESDRPQQVFSGTVPPFGVLHAHHQDENRKFLLWRDYEEEGCVSFTDDDVVVVCDIGIITELAPGETVARRYEVLPSSTTTDPDRTVPPAPGRYRVADSLSFQPSAGVPRTSLSYDVQFALERG